MILFAHLFPFFFLFLHSIRLACFVGLRAGLGAHGTGRRHPERERNGGDESASSHRLLFRRGGSPTETPRRADSTGRAGFLQGASMPHSPILTTVVGSYPFPGWLEHVAEAGPRFGPDDVAEVHDDAVVTVAVIDQVRAGLDVITDGEQSRFDFNLSFYAYLEGIEREAATTRRYGPPAHDQRGKHAITGELAAPRGLGVVEEYQRLERLAPSGPRLKASIPGPYTLSGRLVPNGDYPDRYAVTEALLPIVRDELVRLVDAGCGVVTVDEPSMSCYAYREDVDRLVDIFNRTVEPVVDRCYLGAHLCFGNYKGRAVAPRSYAPMFPAFLSPGGRRDSRRDGEPGVLRARGHRRDRRDQGRRRRCRRCQELLHRASRGHRRADRPLPRADARRSTQRESRLRSFANGTMGSTRQAEEHGGRGASRPGRGLKPPISGPIIRQSPGEARLPLRR